MKGKTRIQLKKRREVHNMKRKAYTDEYCPKCNTRLIWLYIFIGKDKVKVGKFCINCKYFEAYSYFEQDEQEEQI